MCEGWNSLKEIFKGFLIEDADEDDLQFYDVGERTIYVLHEMINDRLVQLELKAIEDMLSYGGFSGEYRVEMDVLDGDMLEIEPRVYDLILIKIPRSSSATGERGMQRG